MTAMEALHTLTSATPLKGDQGSSKSIAAGLASPELVRLADLGKSPLQLVAEL